jgi:hypothetical protein
MLQSHTRTPDPPHAFEWPFPVCAPAARVPVGRVVRGHLDAKRVACEDLLVSGFKFLLVLRGGEPPDPACSVTAAPN